MVDTIKKKGIKEYADGVNVGKDIYESLDDRMKEMVDRAIQRAKDNGRKTVKARDV